MDVEDAARPGLLGFAIHCRDKTTGRERWLENLRIFGDARLGIPETAPDLEEHAAAVLWDERATRGLEAGGRFSTLNNPLQTFRWGDYAVTPGHEYRYRVVALYGKPGSLEQRDAVEIDVTTESPSAGKHGVHFNRGVLASQAYAARFQDRRPSEVADREAYKWLSNGLEEALLAFLAQADGARTGLRAAVYELDYAPVLAAFAAARDRGADVKIVYDAKSGRGKPGPRSLAAIEAAGIDDLVIPRRANPSYIAHNKFILLTRDDRPVAVWTGSTNLTESGIFGQSNVGHVVRDEDVAAKYLAYWEQLASDPAARELRAFNEEATPLDAEARLFPVFSPRRSLDVLESYARWLSEARSSAFLTAAFGVNDLLLGALGGPQAVLRYVLLERDAGDVVMIERSTDNQTAVGGAISEALGRWVAEVDPRAQRGGHVFFVHDKFMLIDPLTSDPILITGSANFSDASTRKNDENMLVIRGDTRVVDIYLGEFLRLFTHYRFRAWVRGLAGDAPNRLRAWSYLDPTDGWTARAYEDGSRERLERLAFAHPDR
jgi:phosphatidylserine/phosphatidylglycerophosphate/cardiolipin synthase-like enzyme